MSHRIVGYITSDPLQDGIVSQKIQNQTIKQYLISNDQQFLLSWTEQKQATPFIFRSLLEEKFYDGICFYSIAQLFHFPEPQEFLQCLVERPLWVGFAREELCFDSKETASAALRLFLLKSLLDKKRQDLEFLWVN